MTETKSYAVPDGAKMGKIAGYRAMSQVELDVFKEVKEAEERVLRYLEGLPDTVPELDPRWLAIGRTHIQQAVMAILRAVARPARISLPEDGGTPSQPAHD
jgi:hypothetical protein